MHSLTLIPENNRFYFISLNIPQGVGTHESIVNTQTAVLSCHTDSKGKIFKNTETSGVYCMNPHKELIIHIKDTVIQYPYIVPVSSHIPTYVPSMIPNT